MSQMFDDRELLERVDGDWDFLTETVQMLATDGRGLMEEIRRSLTSGDAAGVGRAGHTLKGMISNFCSPATHTSAFAVEKIGKSGDLRSAPAAVAALESQLDALITALNDFLATRN